MIDCLRRSKWLPVEMDRFCCLFLSVSAKTCGVNAALPRAFAPFSPNVIARGRTPCVAFAAQPAMHCMYVYSPFYLNPCNLFSHISLYS